MFFFSFNDFLSNSPTTREKIEMEISISKEITFGNQSYCLQAFICHIGSSIHSGHYIAYVNSRGEQWEKCNDTQIEIQKESLEEVLANQSVKKEVYLLFYVRKLE